MDINFNHSFNVISDFFSDVYSKGEHLLTQLFNKGIPPPPPLSPSFWSDFDYWKMTRHLSKEDLSVLEKKIQAFAPYQPAKEAILLQAIEQREWTNSIFQEDYLIYGLAALKAGKLTKNQFGTLCLYWAAATYNTPNKTAQEIRSIPLFTSDGQPNKEACDLIKQTAIKDISISNDTQAFFLQVDDNLDVLLNRMKNSPVSEQQIFIYAVGGGEKSELINRIANDLGVNILTEVTLSTESTEKKTSKYRMIPSVTLMQEVLYILYEEQAVEIDPILGGCSLTAIANNAVEDSRTASFHFPYITPLPEKADDLLAPGIDFTVHDASYHAFIASTTPRSHRYAIARAASVLEQAEKTSQNKAYVVRLKDMETATYRKSKKLEELFKDYKVSLAEQFWCEILIQCIAATGDISNFSLILIDYLQHQEEWQKEFNVYVTPETKDRIAIVTAMVLNRWDLNKKITKIWTFIESGWEVQKLIQEGNLEQAIEIIKGNFPTGNPDWEVFMLDSITAEQRPEHAYFFAAFNNPIAFKIMLYHLPKSILPLYLSGCQVVDDEVLKAVIDRVIQLKKEGYRFPNSTFHLNGCRSLTAQSIENLAKSEKIKFNKFDLSGCSAILDGLSFLPEETTELTLNHIKGLRDEHLEQLKHCSNLIFLSLEHNPFLTDAGLEHLESLSQLRTLRLNECHRVTSEGIKKLIHANNKLLSITITGSRLFDAKTISALQEDAMTRGKLIQIG